MGICVSRFDVYIKLIVSVLRTYCRIRGQALSLYHKNTMTLNTQIDRSMKIYYGSPAIEAARFLSSQKIHELSIKRSNPLRNPKVMNEATNY